MSSHASVISVSDSESDESDNIPPREECERRLNSFRDVTGTDSALAMFYLQERNWELSRAVEDFFQASENKTTELGTSKKVKESVQKTCEHPENTAEKPTSSVHSDDCLTLSAPVFQTQHDSTIKILSWNIDGLDPDNLKSRTEGACGVLLQESPEVIFLQEVVERSLPIIRSKLPSYHIHVGVEGRILPNAYFTVMLLRKDCTDVNSVKLSDFPTSLMSRNLLEVQAKVKGVAIAFLTSHLESTAEHSVERKKQLTIGFNRMKELPDSMTVVFGGDLNLRDKEVTGKPSQIYDIWECTGKRPEAKHTWDLLRNDNKQLGGKFQPRCRFDRLFIRHASPIRVKPVYFELVGIQRLASCRRFPSDHWGILAHIRINRT